MAEILMLVNPRRPERVTRDKWGQRSLDILRETLTLWIIDILMSCMSL